MCDVLVNTNTKHGINLILIKFSLFYNLYSLLCLRQYACYNVFSMCYKRDIKFLLYICI